MGKIDPRTWYAYFNERKEKTGEYVPLNRRKRDANIKETCKDPKGLISFLSKCQK